jgi:hypothetical protein
VLQLSSVVGVGVRHLLTNVQAIALQSKLIKCCHLMFSYGPLAVLVNREETLVGK